MNTTVGAALAAGAILVGGAAILRVNAGPINPPAGAVQSTGVTLTEIADATAAPIIPGAAPAGTHPTEIAISFVVAPGQAPIPGDDLVCDMPDVSRVISMSTQRRRGDVTLGDVVCVKEMDRASPKLAEAACNGTVFPEVNIDLCRVDAASGARVPYYRYKLVNCFVSSYSISSAASSSGEVIPVEHISLNYTEVEWTYKPLNETTVSPGFCVGAQP